MSNLGDALRAAAAKTHEIDAELDDLIARVDANQATLATALQAVLDAVNNIPGTPDLAEIKADVDTLVDTLVPQDPSV